MLQRIRKWFSSVEYPLKSLWEGCLSYLVPSQTTKLNLTNRIRGMLSHLYKTQLWDCFSHAIRTIRFFDHVCVKILRPADGQQASLIRPCRQSQKETIVTPLSMVQTIIAPTFCVVLKHYRVTLPLGQEGALSFPVTFCLLEGKINVHLKSLQDLVNCLLY